MTTQNLAFQFKNFYQFTLLLALALLLMGCGAKKNLSQGSMDLSSRLDANNPGSTDPGLLAECSAIPENNAVNMKGVVSLFYHNQSVLNEWIRFKLNRVPTGITASNSQYFQLYRWGIDSSGKKVTDDGQAIPIYFQLKGTGEYLNTSPEKTVSRNTIQRIITDKKLGDRGINTTNFFQAVILVLGDMDLKYDAMRIALYDSNKGTGVQAHADVLLPAFAANPNTYAQIQPNINLQKIHPNYALRQSALSDQQYWAATETLCHLF